MAHRTLNLVIALAGLLLVAAIVLLGYDAWKMAGTGPRWRRRLLSAALMFLTALGLPTFGAEGAPPVAAPREAPADAAADWQAIQDAWAVALPLARTGKSSSAQRKAADDKMKAASEAITRLAARGLLTSAEGDLLAVEMANLRTDIYREPPTDFRGTCYDMACISPAQQSLQRLNQRLPLVEKLLESGKVNEVAGAKIVVGIEADLAVLNDRKGVEKLGNEGIALANEARAKAAQALQRLRKLLPPPVMCYDRRELPPPKPRNESYLNQRLEHLAALEHNGHLSPTVAARVRQAIEDELSKA